MAPLTRARAQAKAVAEVDEVSSLLNGIGVEVQVLSDLPFPPSLPPPSEFSSRLDLSGRLVRMELPALAGSRPETRRRLTAEEEEELYMPHFFHHQKKNPAFREAEARCQWCQLCTFSTFKRAPIHLGSNDDAAHVPPEFRFIENSILGEGVERAAQDFRSGCGCGNDQDCTKQGCSCLEDMAITPGTSPTANISVYHTGGEKSERLRDEVLASRDPIYECHDGCGCSKKCPNRVVERGRTVPLMIFNTTDGRGLGVRARLHIARGEYVDKYVGEIITSEEASERRKASQVAQRKDVYLFALDKFSDANSNDPRLRGPPLEVDGEFASGPTRFINHSCDPNLRIFARVGDHADKHIHDLAFFALRDIPAGEELTFDYVDGVETDLEQDAANSSLKDQMTPCLCGARRCRGYLW